MMKLAFVVLFAIGCGSVPTMKPCMKDSDCAHGEVCIFNAAQSVVCSIPCSGNQDCCYYYQDCQNPKSKCSLTTRSDGLTTMACI